MIEDYRNAHVGQRVWIVGNGPSAEHWTMEDFHALGGVVFGTNKCWRRSPRTGASFRRTDFHTFVAGQHLDDLLNGRVDAHTVFVPSTIAHLLSRNPWKAKAKKLKSNLVVAPVHKERWNSASDGRPWRYEFGARPPVVSTFAGHLALALSVFMGFSEIMLVGFDAHDGEGHFYDSDERLRVSKIFKRENMVLWFDAIGEWWWPKWTPTIFNCNPESAIRVFPFTSREEMFSWNDGRLSLHSNTSRTR